MKEKSEHKSERKSHKSERKSVRKLTSEINRQTKHGTVALQQGDFKQALEHFESCFKRSLQLSDAFTERACAFNVGAVYISMNNPEQGLAFLQRAIPPSGTRDAKSNGDLYYNFGLGYEALEDFKESTKYYELAIDEYKEEGDNYLMEAEVGSRAGSLYIKLGQTLEAARCLGIAATAYSRVGDTEHQTLSLCQQASCLYQAGRRESALQAADQCSILCQRLKDESVLGRLYNELGLTYTQCHEFAKAATCFELALPLSRSPQSNSRQEAIVLQNLGAVYNSLGDYQRAIPLHESAISLHADLGQRSSQGQCFQNLAFAFSQLGDHEAAGECYLHALQAARDTGEEHGQWQAMEGLGAVAYHEGRYKRAVRYFQMAAQVLANSEDNSSALKRIQAKITSSLRSEKSGLPAKDNHISDSLRPDRQDSFDYEALRNKNLRNRASDTPFGFIAQGIGAYDGEQDRAFSRASYKMMYAHMSGLLREGTIIAEQDSQSETERQAPRRVVKHSHSRTTTGGSLEAAEKAENNGQSTKAMLEELYGAPVVHRRRARPLLRSEDHDSEEEWKEHMKQIRSSSDSDDMEYKERLFPAQVPASPSSQKKAVRRKKLQEKFLEMVDGDNEEFMRQYHKALSKKNVNRKEHIVSSGQSPTDSPKKGKVSTERKRKDSNDFSSERSNDESVFAVSHEKELGRVSNESESETADSRVVSQRKDEDKTEVEKEEESEIKDEDKTEDEKEEESEINSQSSSRRGSADGGAARLAPSVPLHLPLGTTYEQPVDDRPPGANFFRVSPPPNQNDTDVPSTSLTNEEDPMYATIKSVRTLPFKAELDEQSSLTGPDLPTRPASLPPRETLAKYQEERDTHLVQRADTVKSDGEISLPSKSNQKSSKTCTIM